MLQISPIEIKKQRKFIVVWSVTFNSIPLAHSSGVAHANESGEVIKIGMDKFYMLMTCTDWVCQACYSACPLLRFGI
jgi:hypothetical protein